MTLWQHLQQLGDRLGIIESGSKSSGKRYSKVHTRTVTLSDLTSEIRSQEVRSLAQNPAELTVPFEKIFEAAGLKTPSHGWDIPRMLQLLQTEPFMNQSRQEVQKRLLSALRAENVNVEDLVRDAVARDQALDAYEAFVRRKMEDRLSVIRRNLADLETKLVSLQEEKAQMAEKLQRESRQWDDWVQRKNEHESRLTQAVDYLVDRAAPTAGE